MLTHCNPFLSNFQEFICQIDKNFEHSSVIKSYKVELLSHMQKIEKVFCLVGEVWIIRK